MRRAATPSHTTTLPRFANRGLIEARLSGSAASGQPEHFPDSRIGASLKPCRLALNAARSMALPRFANRGLIEAASPATRRIARRPLPRFANRGLIEAIPCRKTSRTRPNFPDSRIGASLKPGSLFQSAPVLMLLPRFANRGLIEAGARAGAEPPTTPLPRFANRGLIEAPGLPPDSWKPHRNFPDSRIGASLKPGSQTCNLSRSADFPDSRIGASLKLAGQAPPANTRRNFPDSRIGASLKPL